MKKSIQSIHGLSIIDYNNVSQNTKQKNFKSTHGNNVRHTDNLKIKKKEPRKQKADVKKSKTKPPRKSASRKNVKESLSVCSCYVKRLIHSTAIRTTSSRNRQNQKTPGVKNNQIQVLFSCKSRKQNENIIKDIYYPPVNNHGILAGWRRNSKGNLKKRRSASTVPMPVLQCNPQQNSNTTLREDVIMPNHSSDIPLKFKVVNFPNYDQTDSELEAINMNRDSEIFNLLYTNGKNKRKPQICKPSRPRICGTQRGEGDATNAGNQCLCSKKEAANAGNQCLCSKKEPANAGVQCLCSKKEAASAGVQCLCSKKEAASAGVQCLCSKKDAASADIQCLCSKKEADSADIQCLCSKNDAAGASIHCLCSKKDAASAKITCLCSEKDAVCASIQCLCSEKDAACAAGINLYHEKDPTSGVIECLCPQKDAASVGIQCLCSKKRRKKHKKSSNKGLEGFFDPSLYIHPLHKKVLNFAKIALKYLIFGLAILVWSPCMITVYLCWFITYPLRPRYTRTCTIRNSQCKPTQKLNEVCEPDIKQIRDNCMQTCKKDVWLGLLKAVQPVAGSVEALKSLFIPNTNKLRRPPCCNKKICRKESRVMRKNQQKKCSLYSGGSKCWITHRPKQPPKTNNCGPCNSKRAAKVKLEPCCKQMNTRKPITDGSRYPQCGCRVHAEKHACRSNKKNKNSHHQHRHRHISADASNLPVKELLSNFNPKTNNNVSNRRHFVKPGIKLKMSKSSTPPKIFKGFKGFKAFKSFEGFKGFESERIKGIKEFAISQYERLDKLMQKYEVTRRMWRCSKANCIQFKTLINTVEGEAFGDGKMNCNNIYIQTLRRTPWYFIYRMCPTFYPTCLGIYNFYKQFWHFLLLLTAACIWCPFVIVWYLCYKFFKCS